MFFRGGRAKLSDCIPIKLRCPFLCHRNTDGTSSEIIFLWCEISSRYAAKILPDADLFLDVWPELAGKCRGISGFCRGIFENCGSFSAFLGSLCRRSWASAAVGAPLPRDLPPCRLVFCALLLHVCAEWRKFAPQRVCPAAGLPEHVVSHYPPIHDVRPALHRPFHRFRRHPL